LLLHLAVNTNKEGKLYTRSRGVCAQLLSEISVSRIFFSREIYAAAGGGGEVKHLVYTKEM